MSYKYGVHMREGDKPSFNSCAYATRDEADRAGRELLSRWLLPSSYSIHRSDETVNYRFKKCTSRPESILLPERVRI